MTILDPAETSSDLTQIMSTCGFWFTSGRSLGEHQSRLRGEYSASSRESMDPKDISCILICAVSLIYIHTYITLHTYIHIYIHNCTVMCIYIYICTHIIHEPLPTITRITSGNLDVERTQLESCFLQWLWLKDANQNQWLLKMTSHSCVHTPVTWAIAKLSLHFPKNTVYYIYIYYVYIIIHIYHYISHLFNVSYGCLGMIPFI